MVLPAITWQGLNRYDSDLDGFGDTLFNSRSIPVDRPFQGGGLPPRFRREVVPLLDFLDRSHLAYDITTDVSLARREGPALGNATGAAIAASAIWVPRVVRDRLRAGVEDEGQAVAVFGGESLRRSVALVGGRLRDPSPARARRPLRRADAPLPAPIRPRRCAVLQRGPRHLRRGRFDLFGEFSVFEKSVRLPRGARLLASAGRDDTEPAFVAYRLGKGMVIRPGTPEWAGQLDERALGLEVPRVTRNIWRLCREVNKVNESRPRLPSWRAMKRGLLIAGVLLVLGGGAAAAYKVLDKEDPPEKRGSAKVEFDTGDTPKPKPPPKALDDLAWPTFGYDIERTKVSPYPHRPPFHRTWKLVGHNALEFPPSAAFGNVYLAQQKGLFFAVNGKTGKPRLQDEELQALRGVVADARRTTRSTSPTWTACPASRARPNPTGFVIAMNAKTGSRSGASSGKPFESSPLLRKGVLYVGSWDGNVYAIRARDGKKLWSHQTGDRVNTSAAYADGRIFIANDSGTLFALSARTGKQIGEESDATRSSSTRPRSTAYGRVYIGGTDGTMYSYGQKTGHLLWAKPLGTYIYSPAAVYQRHVFTGTYDGKLYSLDAATGDTRWERDVPSAVHGSPVGDGRPRLRRRLLELRLGGARNVKHGAEGSRGLRHPQRPPRLAQRGRQVRQPDHRRQGPRLPHGRDHCSRSSRSTGRSSRRRRGRRRAKKQPRAR